MLLDSIGVIATAPGAAGAAGAAVTGDSLTIKAGTPGTNIWMLGYSALNQTAGFHQLTAPSFNDTTRGLRWTVPAALATLISPLKLLQPLQPQLVLTSLIAGSAVAGDIEQGCIQVLYEDLPGQAGRYIDEATLMQRAVREMTIVQTPATGAAGGWSGSAAINSASDLLRANTDYAVVGITTSVAACAIGLRAPDWANARVAVPGSTTFLREGARWFLDLSEATGIGLIPVFNSANKGAVNLDAMVDENGADPIVTVHLVELSP